MLVLENYLLISKNTFCDAHKFLIFIFVMLRNIYISRETGTPIMISRAAQNQIVYTTKQHEIPLCIFHEQPIIKNNRVSEQHKISMNTQC
jgi:hypothetical protein